MSIKHIQALREAKFNHAHFAFAAQPQSALAPSTLAY